MAYPLAAPRVSAAKQAKANKFLLEYGAYEFDQLEFRISRPSRNMSMQWISIDSIVSMRGGFAICTTKNCFNPIPRRFIPAKQLEGLQALFAEALQDNSKPPITRWQRY